MSQIPVTVIILTKNEEKAIDTCLGALKNFDQVVVVDSNSTDETHSIAKDAGAEVVNFTWNGQYPKKKQWCLENVTLRHDWVLFIDADERPSEQLLTEMSAMISGPHSAYDIELDYYFMGRLLRHGHRVTKRALVRASRTSFPKMLDIEVTSMGEVEGHYQPHIDGTIGQGAGRIIHADPDPFSTWISRHNRYSDWEAWLRTHPEAAQQINTARSARGRRYARIPFKAPVFFVYSYIARLGFLDGRAGLNYALAHAFYFWQIDVKTSEMRP